MDSPVILISGCSTGFGRELALAALEKGLRVIATARRLSSLEDLKARGAHTLELEVTAPVDDLVQFAKKVVEVYGRVDCLVNNAGYLLGGAIEECTHEEIVAQFSTLFFGLVNLTNVFLPFMRQARKGAIVNISSQGAVMNIPGAGVYCAAKAAVDSISDTWSKELADFNIRCMTVQLGSFRTAVATSGNLKTGSREIEGYNQVHDWLRGFSAAAMKEKGDPRKAAERIIELVAGGEMPRRLALGDDAVGNVEQAYRGHLAELERWRARAVGTSYDDE